MFNPNFNFTQLQHLSAVIAEKLQNLTQTEIFSAIQMLSSLPADPWERLKVQYFDEGYEFPCLSSIPQPKNFKVETCIQKISCAQLQFAQNISEQLTGVTVAPLTGIDFKMNLKHVRTIIEMTALGRSITIDEIKQNPVQVAQKLLSYYSNTI